MDWNWNELGAIIASLVTGAAGAHGISKARSPTNPKGSEEGSDTMAAILQKIYADSHEIKSTLSSMKEQQESASAADQQILEGIRRDIKEALEANNRGIRDALDKLVTFMIETRGRKE